MDSKAKMTAISRTTAQAFSGIFGVALARFAVVPLAFDHACDWPGVKPNAEWDWASRPYLVYPANPTVYKNHELLFKAVAAWEFKLPLVLIGTGLQGRPLGRAAVLKLAAERDGFRFGKSLISLGHVEDDVNSAVIAHAWAMVFPSLSEGCGFPPAEALVCGVPAICSDIPALREYLEPAGEAVLWFDPRDPESLVNRLQEMEKHYDVYKSRAMNQREEFTRRAWRNVAEEYWKIFA
jgi:glycosyltransferase involved in cell wall biosynthesis